MVMHDTSKFGILLIATTGLILVMVAAALFREYAMSDAAGYQERKQYYEHSIVNKNLSLHPALYWKEKQ